MTDSVKRGPGRPRKSPPGPAPKYRRVKSLADSAEELVRFETILFRHQAEKLARIAMQQNVSKNEINRQAIDALPE
jgi:hypothetical protein